jgi:hypothetical protein
MGPPSDSMTKLIELLSVCIHILVQRVHVIKVTNVVEVVPSLMMRITTLKILKYQKLYKKLYLKMLVDSVKSKVINMLKDIVY